MRISWKSTGVRELVTGVVAFLTNMTPTIAMTAKKAPHTPETPESSVNGVWSGSKRMATERTTTLSAHGAPWLLSLLSCREALLLPCAMLPSKRMRMILPQLLLLLPLAKMTPSPTKTLTKQLLLLLLLLRSGGPAASRCKEQLRFTLCRW